MNFYISDLHFGHKNVIRFDHRPFYDTEEMDNVLIQLWNERVSDDDNVYILGDFAYKSDKTADWYLKQLKGHKYLIIGNHDKSTLDNPKAMKYFEGVDKMMHVSDQGREICLCHYPIADWYKGRHGSWHIYGHIHEDVSELCEFMHTRRNSLNAAACINNYTPVTFNELIRNNKYFWEKHAHKTELLALAEKIARVAHEKQVDKAGVPYINHPMTVASFCDSIDTKIVGWLHDVVEDTPVTFECLLRLGFDEYLIDALRCVTKEDNYDEKEYYTRIKNNEIARKVKLADLTHNLDVSRIPQNAPEELKTKMFNKHKKYEKYKSFLEGDLLWENLRF